jgi:hypothetical protein
MAILARWCDNASAAGRMSVSWLCGPPLTCWGDNESLAGWRTVLAHWRDTSQRWGRQWYLGIVDRPLLARLRAVVWGRQQCLGIDDRPLLSGATMVSEVGRAM